MKILSTLFIVCTLLLSSCGNKIDKTINGNWSIDTIYYKNYDVRSCFYSSLIRFEDERIVKLPISENHCNEVISNSKNEFGDWKIIQSANLKDTLPLQLKIATNNEFFSGIHHIVFYKDELNKLLKMEIWSDSLYIVCRKGLFDFDSNIDLINELEKISWTNRPGIHNNN